MYVIIFGQFCVLGPVYMEGQPRPQGAFPKPGKSALGTRLMEGVPQVGVVTGLDEVTHLSIQSLTLI